MLGVYTRSTWAYKLRLLLLFPNGRSDCACTKEDARGSVFFTEIQVSGATLVGGEDLCSLRTPVPTRLRWTAE